MRSLSVGPWARILAWVASPTLLLLLLVGPVAAAGPVGMINVDSDATIDLHSGAVTVSGTVDCTSAGSIELNAFASQQIGQAVVEGFGFGSAVCPGAGSTVAWEMIVFGDSARFNPGGIDLFVDERHCLPEECVDDHFEAQVTAHPIGKAPPPPPTPSNDEPAGSIALTLDGAAFTQDTSGATSGADDPACPEIQPFASHTVWFTIAAGTDTGIALTTVGSNFDTTLAVLDETGTPIACNDDVEAGVIRYSELVFGATAGTTYTIVAGSWEETAGGSLVLAATSVAVPPPPPPPPPVPASDSPSGALPLVIGTPATQDTRGATAGPEDPAEGVCDLPLNGATVWYTLDVSAADAGWVQVDTLTSDYDTVIYVFDSTGALLACNDQAPMSNQSLLVFLAESETYSVLVGSWNRGPGGSLVLTATPTVVPLTAEVTIDSIGAVDTKTGDATITGTITCSEEASGGLFVSLSQEGGRFVANSFAEVEIASCGPDATAWSAAVPRGTAKFQVGTAFAFVEAFVANASKEAGAFADAEVELQPAGSMN